MPVFLAMLCFPILNDAIFCSMFFNYLRCDFLTMFKKIAKRCISRCPSPTPTKITSITIITSNTKISSITIITSITRITRFSWSNRFTRSTRSIRFTLLNRFNSITRIIRFCHFPDSVGLPRLTKVIMKFPMTPYNQYRQNHQYHQ